MWEDRKTGSKWVIVNSCYFPSDLPENVGRPSTPESNEVYCFLVYISLCIYVLQVFHINVKVMWLPGLQDWAY